MENIYPCDQVNDVINHFGIDRYVGIGVGLGANVLIRHVLKYPQRVYSLMIINADCSTPGWIEWGYQKRNISILRQLGMTNTVMDYFMWYHFGSRYDSVFDIDMGFENCMHMLRPYVEKIHASNLAKLTEKYIWRTAIDLDIGRTVTVPVLNVVGSYSHFVYDAAILNNKLNPKKTEWMMFQDCGMVVFGKSRKLAEVFRIFLQGQGLCQQIITMQTEKLTPRLFSFFFNSGKLLSGKSTNEICSPEHQELIKEDILKEKFTIKEINLEELYEEDVNEDELYEEDLSEEELI